MIDRLPLFPLGTVLLPGVPLPLHVFEPRYRALVSDLLAEPEPRAFGVVAIREGHEVGADSVRSLYDVGCVAVIRQMEQAPDGRFALMTTGSRRFRLQAIDESRPYLQADVELLDEPIGDTTNVDALAQGVRRAFTDYRTAIGSSDVDQELPDDPTAVSYLIAASGPFGLPERQALLETADTSQRLGREIELLNREIGLVRTLHTVPIEPSQLPRSSQN